MTTMALPVETIKFESTPVIGRIHANLNYFKEKIKIPSLTG
jgi:hypothetical protein